MFILAWTLSLNTYVNVGNSLNIHVHVDLFKMLCYFTYQITVICCKLLLIGLNAYNNNIVKIIVINCTKCNHNQFPLLNTCNYND